MRLALIADIHANAPALAAVLAALDGAGVERILALGDLVGYNAMPHETLGMLRARHIPSVGGNHDLMAIGRLPTEDRKSTRLNSSHSSISYAVFCLKKKNEARGADPAAP